MLNQDQRPFAGLLVFCNLALPVDEDEIPHNWGSEARRTLTGEDGGFVLDGLPGAPYEVHIGDYEPDHLGKCKAAFWIEPVDVDLGSVDSVDLPPVQLDESRPFRFEGQIELDAAWAAKRELSLGNLRVEIDLLDPDAPRAAAPRRPSFRKDRLEVDESGRLVWMCETPHAPVRITVRAKKMDDPVEVLLYPEPGGQRSETVPIPARGKR